MFYRFSTFLPKTNPDPSFGFTPHRIFDEPEAALAARPAAQVRALVAENGEVFWSKALEHSEPSKLLQEKNLVFTSKGTSGFFFVGVGECVCFFVFCFLKWIMLVFPWDLLLCFQVQRRQLLGSTAGPWFLYSLKKTCLDHVGAQFIGQTV